MYRCHKLPHDQKPSMQEWNDSSQSHRLSALQSFALSRADTADSTLAIQMMQVRLLLSVMLLGSEICVSSLSDDCSIGVAGGPWQYAMQACILYMHGRSPFNTPMQVGLVDHSTCGEQPCDVALDWHPAFCKESCLMHGQGS